MSKKIILLLAFFITSVFVKAQINSLQNTDKKEKLTESKIAQDLDKARKSGTQEWEIAVKKKLLNEKINQPIANKNENSQTPHVNATSCVNPGFEDGTTNGWTFFSGQICSPSTNLPCNTCPTTPGALTWVTNATGTFGACTQDNAGTDFYSGLSAIAPGSGNNYSLLLNNACTNGKIEKAVYSFVVSPSTNIFTFQYAVVLNSGGHPPNEQPYFHVDATDITTGSVIPCTEYDATAPTSGSLNGWSVSAQNNQVYTYPWTSVALDLSAPAYNNHTIQVNFIVSDCNQCGHFGYCYIDASCNSNLITLTKGICPGGGPGILTGPPGFATYSWVNSSNTVVGTNQVFSTNTPGSYTLNTTSATSCPSPSMFATLTASPDPTPLFTNSVPPCGSNVTLTDGSTVSSGSIVNWQWNFGDGSASVNSATGASQTHVYNPPGNYTVTLKDSTDGGCIATYTAVVNANGGGPVPVFSSNSPPTAPQCFTGNNVVFTNTSSAPAGVTITGYQWDFGDGSTGTSTVGTPNTSHSYTNCGTFVVTLTVTTTTCNGTTTQTVVINPSPTASFNAPTVCLGNASVFTSTVASTPCTSATYTYNWAFSGAGTGSNITTATPTFTYSAAGTFPVTLTVTAVGGCSVTATNNVIVGPDPTASFTVAPVCEGTASHFDASASTPGATYSWSFGGAAPNTDVVTVQTDNHTYSTSGTFPVTLLVAIGTCTAMATGNAVVNPMPVLSFNTVPACDQAPICINNTTAAPATFTVWAWTYGDGATDATAAPPCHTYSAAGIYTVSVTATTATGCSGTVTATATVHPNPMANGGVSEACLGDATQFVDASTLTNPVGINDNITTWNWSYGDGNSSPLASPTYTYAICNVYTVSLTVTTNFNCTNTISGTDTVYCLPTVTAPASFSICPGTPVTSAQTTFVTTCNAPSYGIPAAIVFVNNPNPTNNTTTTHGGIPLADTVDVNSIPNYPAINPNTTCGLLVDTIYGYAVTLVTNTVGVTNVACIGNMQTFTISVYPTPTVTPVNSATVCANVAVPAVNFTGCPIATETFTWTTAAGANVGLAATGAGNIASFPGQNITDMPAIGTVSITPLANGCTGPSTTYSITVNPIPTMTVTSPTPYCPGDVISSTTNGYNVNTDPVGIVTYNWTATNNAGTGMPANGTGNAPNTPYNAPANPSQVDQNSIITYTPSLAGCIGLAVTETVTVKPTPTMVAMADQFWCPGATTTAVPLATLPASAASTYSWSYNMPPVPVTGTSNPFPPLGPTQNPGLTTLGIAITVTPTLNGCVGPPSGFNIYVYPNPIAKFSATDKVCDGFPMNFTDLSKPNTGSITVNQWAWDMNSDGSIDMSSQNPTYTYPAGSTGTNSVTLYIGTSSAPSCTAQVTEPIYINPNPVADFVGDSLKSCPTLHTQFSNLTTVLTPTTGISYVWTFGNGNTSTLQTPPLQTYTNGSATQSAYYNVSLTATTDSGCVNTKTKVKYIQVYPRPIANFGWGPTDADIDEPTITFVNEAIGASPYVPVTYGPHGVQYYLDDIYASNPNANNIYGDNAIGSTFTHTYEHYDTATYYVTQWVINNLGCKDEITKPVHIGPNFTFYIPNAFSPNGDGTNEGFKGLGVGIDNSTYNLWVFDRWGLMIFYANDIDKSWDGHMKGDDSKPVLQEDVYVWKVKFNDFTGKKHEYHGTVTLLK